MDFQKLFLGIKPKKVLARFKSTLKVVNFAHAPYTYSKKNISYNGSADDYYATYEVTHLFATEYRNTFTSQAFFSRDRRYIKKKIFGKEVERFGPWYYYARATAIFHALPMKDLPKTQAKLQQLFPEVKFNFYKDTVEVYYGHDVKTINEATNVIWEFKRIYDRIYKDLVANMNYIHDELHKK